MIVRDLDHELISGEQIRRGNLYRRDFLRVGCLSALGMTASGVAGIRTSMSNLACGEDKSAGQTETKMSNKIARNCILIWLDGGPSHLETFDPKPDAPPEVRGPFGTVATSVVGVHLSDLMPRMAERMKDVAIIRSVTSTMGEHNFGTHYLLTGFKPTPALNYPSIGSVVAALDRQNRPLPTNVAIPDHRVGGGRFVSQGFLSSQYRPLEIGGDPGKADFRVQDLDLFTDVTPERLKKRQEYLRRLNEFAETELGQSQLASDPQFEQSFQMMRSADARGAFDLASEPDEIRRQYGPRTIGQSCLLARRLIQRGTRFVTVNNTGWDTHEDLVTRLKEGYTGAKTPVGLIPSLDTALSALIDDLRKCELLDETLIVVMGEFGRTPKLNTAGGRDHWPRVFSLLMAGGSVAGGQVIGSSDNVGQSPVERAVTPADVAATIYQLLGFDPRTKLVTPAGRPIQIAGEGSVISEICG